MVCGLDVWFPSEMIALKSHVEKSIPPLIIELDFKKLNNNVIGFYKKINHQRKKKYFTSECIYDKILDSIKNNHGS